MRVLLLNRYSIEQTNGGVAEYLYYLPIALRPYGVEALLYSESDEGVYQLTGPRYLENGMSAYTGPFIKPGFFVSNRKLKPLLDLCRTENIDLIHAQGTYRSGYIAMQVHKHISLPYVVTSHADIVKTNSDRMKRRVVQGRCREILRHAAAVTHLTPLMAEVSHQIYDASAKSVVIGNGIDLAGWANANSAAEQNYLLGIGRLVPEKGFNILIDAYAELRNQGVSTSLVIAGTGPEATALQNQARHLGLNVVTDFQEISSIPEDSVVFTGYVKDEKKKQLVSQSRLILFPTQPSQWEEPFGIVQIEAMAAGKAMVASDSATTRYLQSFGLQAVLVKADDILAWAGQIQVLLHDTAFRNKLGKINLANAQQFDWDIIAKQYRDVYLSCLGS